MNYLQKAIQVEREELLLQEAYLDATQDRILRQCFARRVCHAEQVIAALEELK